MKKLLSVISFLSLITLFSTVSFAETEWVVIEKSSHLNFVALQSGKPIKGKFKKFTPEISFDKDDLDNSHIKVTIETGSATTNDKMSNNSLTNKDWLNVDAFPDATFETTFIEPAPSDEKGVENYVASGTLTIMGVSKNITLPFSLSKNGANTRAYGTFSLNRLHYGVGSSIDPNGIMIEKKIAVSFDILAHPAH